MLSRNTIQELRQELEQLEHRRQAITALLPLYELREDPPAPQAPTKFCKNCSRTKPLSEFNRHPNSKDRLQYQCKACQHETYKEAAQKRRNGNTNGHRHHWKLPAPNGPTSVATCSCGAERTMANSDEALTSLQEAHR